MGRLTVLFRQYSVSESCMSVAITSSTETASSAKTLWIGNSVFAIADQVLISGTNFVTMVLLARGLSSPAAFGAFVLVHSILLFSNSLQSALVTQPHNVLGASRHGQDYIRYTSSTIFLQIALALLAGTAIGFVWVVGAFVGWSLSPLILAMLPTVIAWQLHEFMRRVLYTENRTSMALLIDVLGYGGQLLAICVLYWRGHMTGPSALYAISGASAVAATVGIWQIRKSISWHCDWDVIRENWHFGKWLAGGYIVGNWFSSQFLIFLAAGVLGTGAAGILRAIHTIFGPMRILAQAFSTLLPTRFARTLAHRGQSAFRLDVRKAFLIATPLLGGYCLLVSVFSSVILTAAFGEKYAGHERLLMLYAISAFLGYLSIIFAASLRATRHTRQIFYCELSATLAVVPLSGFLIPLVGIDGVVLGMIFTDLTLLILFYRTYRAILVDTASLSFDAAQTIIPIESEEQEQEFGCPLTKSSSSPGRQQLLLQVFDALDKANIPYCVSHGYQGYPEHIPSDVDCIMPEEVLITSLPMALRNLRGKGITIVQWLRGGAHGIVLRLQTSQVYSAFLQLDVSDGCNLNKRLHFYSAEEILKDRRRYKQFWVPSSKMEFGCSLIRRVTKGNLDEVHLIRLSQLYREDRSGCQEQIGRFWGRASTAVLTQAAESDNWEVVRKALLRLRIELLVRAALRCPIKTLLNALSGATRRVKRCFKPGGFHLALLGPDGAGKSTIANAVQQELSPAFLSSACRSFPPRLLNRPVGDPSSPHEILPRSRSASILRAALYWWTYYSPGYFFTVHPALVGNSLVIHDRHLIDCLIDPVRYRYSGPDWLVRLIWRWTPKPELIILLDVPADVIQARKQEVPYEVSFKQRIAYRELVEQLPNGRIVNGARPLDQVVTEVKELILHNLTNRLVH
jgi:O-antigen/teichoic acid export membrane protein/thymidylate kinase